MDWKTSRIGGAEGMHINYSGILISLSPDVPLYASKGLPKCTLGW